jgi:hypothetical protein
MQGYRHAGVLIYLILFVLWISEKEKFNHFRGVSISISVLSRKIGILLFAICTFYSMRFGYKEARKDLLYSFSGGKEAAEFIQKNHFDNEDYILSAHKADNAKSILPYLNTKNLYDPATDHYGSYSLWNKKYTEANFFSQEIAVQTIRNKFPNQKVLFISTTKSPSPQNLGMELIYETNSRVEFYKDEIFYLYKLY